MYSSDERASIRAALIEKARADDRIVGAALAGSAARDAEDAWSDIDLVLQLAADTNESAAVTEWTEAVDRISPTADTHDVVAGGVRYRVFLLDSSLQIDVSFWPFDRFRATEPAFRLLFGTPNEPTSPKPIDTADEIGMGWLYALHARSALARGRLWQANTMLDELRGTLITLKCARLGLNPWHGREVDRLPAGDLAELAASRAAEVGTAALDASRTLLTRQFLTEVGRHDPRRAERLRPPFEQLARSAG